MNLTVYRAMYEDTDKGWIWMTPPAGRTSRSTICLSHTWTTIEKRSIKRSIYCEIRAFDEDFIRRYDESIDERSKAPAPKIFFEDKKILELQSDLTKAKIYSTYFPNANDVPLESLSAVVVMGSWYRSALGIGTGPAEIELSTPWAFWADIRGACHHPEPFVRVGMRLAITGAWLGTVALLLALAATDWIKTTLGASTAEEAAFVLGLASLLPCYIAGRGVHR